MSELTDKILGIGIPTIGSRQSLSATSAAANAELFVALMTRTSRVVTVLFYRCDGEAG